MNNYRNYEFKHPEYHPVRHRRKDLYSINVHLSPDYRSKVENIRNMDAEMRRFILSLKDYAELVSEAHSVNVHWSTRIEGNKLSLEQVRESSRRILGSKRIISVDPGPVQEILNHLYSYFTMDTYALPWDVGTAEAVHRILMKDTGEDCELGRVRETEEMSVTDENGQETFIACPAIHVRKELDDLFRWVNDSPYDPMITAVVFFHEFESIHPFTEGNGRTGRSLFHILMQELGLRRFSLCKLEDKLLSDSRLYYSLLEYTDESQDYTPITEFFIDCIERAYTEALKIFSEKDILKDLDESTVLIALGSKAHSDWFSVSEAQSWVRGLSDQTVRAKLALLIDRGVLEKEGKTRSTRFRFSDPFRGIKEQFGIKSKD